MNMADITSTHAAFITCSDIWFEDGNIVIQAERTQFKVHRGVLGANSSVFKDMFSMPQPPPSEGEVTVEGCPVVHLSDTAADVAIVLQALFLRGHVVAGGPLPMTAVAAFLRLGKKYEIDPLHAEAIKRLRYEFPSTLHDFDACNPGSMIIGEYGLCISAANLAREQNLLWALPLALYHCCCRYKAKDLAAGIKRHDDTTITLSAGDLLPCLAASSSLGTAQYDTTLVGMRHPFTSAYYPTCTSPPVCDDVRRFTMSKIFIPFADFVGLESWIKFNSDWLEGRFDDEMCSVCVEASEQLHNQGRVEFWESLPGIFGLPEWDELRRE